MLSTIEENVVESRGDKGSMPLISLPYATVTSVDRIALRLSHSAVSVMSALYSMRDFNTLGADVWIERRGKSVRAVESWVQHDDQERVASGYRPIAASLCIMRCGVLLPELKGHSM